MPNVKKRKFIFTLISLGLLGLLALGVWWGLGNDSSEQKRAGVVAVHAFPWEKNLLQYPKNGIPANSSKSGSVEGATWSVEVDLDDETISPTIGAKLSGKVRVLRDGNAVSEIPKNLAPGIRFGWEGIVTYRCASPLVVLPNFTDIGTNCGGLFEVPLGTEAEYGMFKGAPKSTALSSFVVSPAAEHSVVELTNKSGELWGDNYLKITQPATDFTLVYMGGRYLPYVNVQAYLGEDIKNPIAIANEVAMFRDQVSPDWDIDVAEIHKGDIYYETATSVEERIYDTTSSARGGTLKHIKVLRVDIAAKDSKTNQVDTSPYQRIRAWAFPLIVNDGYPRPDEYAGEFVDRSYITGEGYQQPNNIQITPPGAIFDNFGSSGGGMGTAVEVDLIDGRGTVYYATGGLNLSQAYSSRLAIMVQPAHFGMAQCSFRGCFWTIRKYEDMPDLPEDFKGFDRQFLYKEWLDDWSLVNQIYSIATYPLADLLSS